MNDNELIEKIINLIYEKYKILVYKYNADEYRILIETKIVYITEYSLLEMIKKHDNLIWFDDFLKINYTKYYNKIKKEERFLKIKEILN